MRRIHLTEVIGVRFKKVGKVYYFDPAGLQVSKGPSVIVETARGVEIGETVLPNRMVDDEHIVAPLRRVLRIATEEDLAVVARNEKKEAEAFAVCQKKIAEHKLDMRLVTVEYTFDMNKILFYFTADGRVDFRELVKDLASVFRTRIELRQIGVRDEAKMIGGLGICGNPLCCSTFLDDFQPVSINMAKEQGLSLNPTKISGTCGRLMCCLKYEQEAYEDLTRRTPPVDSLVETPQGIGTVTEISLIKGILKVRLEKSPEAPKQFTVEDCKVLRSGRGPRPENLPPPQMPERPERPERPEVKDRPPRRVRDRSERSDRPERSERPERPERPERSDRPERAPRDSSKSRDGREQQADGTKGGEGRSSRRGGSRGGRRRGENRERNEGEGAASQPKQQPPAQAE